MRKRVFMLLLFFLFTGIYGCSSGHSEEINSEDELLQITVGCGKYAPFTNLDGSGDFVGVDVDLAVEAFHRLGYEPVFKEITWKNKSDFLENGTVDCIWSCLEMDDGRDEYTWAGPYLYSRYVIVVKSNSGINTFSDLTGKRIAVQAASVADKLLSENTTGLPEVGEIYALSAIDEVSTCLRKGYVDAMSGHEMAMNVFVQDNPDTYYILSESLCEVGLGVAFQKDTHLELAEALTDTLEQMKEDGTIRTMIESYGFDADKALEGEKHE